MVRNKDWRNFKAHFLIFWEEISFSFLFKISIYLFLYIINYISTWEYKNFMKVPIFNRLPSLASNHILHEHYQVSISFVLMNSYTFSITQTNHHASNQVLSLIDRFAILIRLVIFSIFLLSILALVIIHFKSISLGFGSFIFA